MKLACCLFNYFPFGGLQRDFFRIGEVCIKRGHTVDVYTMGWEGAAPTGMTIHLLPSKKWQNHQRIREFVEQLQPHLVAHRYDVVIGFNKMPGIDVYYAADTCFQAKARKRHGAWYRLTPRYRQLVAYEKAVFTKQARTNILFLSPDAEAEFHRFYQTPSSRCHLLPPGIAMDRKTPLHAHSVRQCKRQELHLSENEFLFMMVGSGFKTKGLDRILRGFAALPEEIQQRSQLAIVGQDDAKPFKRQALRLKIAHKITFLGGRKDVPALLLAADALLHPAYNENTGTVLLEAVIAGLPVLTTDVCGYADYILKSDTGLVLPSPFRQTEFNQAMIAMVSSPNRKNWQQNGRAFAETANIYSMPERAVDFIESFGRTIA